MVADFLIHSVQGVKKVPLRSETRLLLEFECMNNALMCEVHLFNFFLSRNNILCRFFSFGAKACTPWNRMIDRRISSYRKLDQ